MVVVVIHVRIETFSPYPLSGSRSSPPPYPLILPFSPILINARLFSLYLCQPGHHPTTSNPVAQKKTKEKRASREIPVPELILD